MHFRAYSSCCPYSAIRCKNSNTVFLMWQALWQVQGIAFCTFLQKSMKSNEKVRKVNTRFRMHAAVSTRPHGERHVLFVTPQVIERYIFFSRPTWQRSPTPQMLKLGFSR